MGGDPRLLLLDPSMGEGLFPGGGFASSPVISQGAIPEGPLSLLEGFPGGAIPTDVARPMLPLVVTADGPQVVSPDIFIAAGELGMEPQRFYDLLHGAEKPTGIFFAPGSNRASLVPFDPAEPGILAGNAGPIPLDLILHASRMGIAPKDIHVLLSNPARVAAATAELEGAIEKGLTPERICAWLSGPDGRAWMAKNWGVLEPTLRQRLAAGLPGIALGVAAYLPADLLADAIGIEQPQLRFLFIAYAMHGFSEVGRAAGEVVVNRFIMKRPFDFMRQALVREGEGMALRVTFEARGSISRSLARAVSSNFAAEGTAVSLQGGARRVLSIPLRMAGGMGPGLAVSRVVDSVLKRVLPPGSEGIREWASFGSFVAADLAIEAMSRRAKGFSKSIGLRIVGRAFVAGFALDCAVGFFRWVALGDEADYFASVQARISERVLREGEREVYGRIAEEPWYFQALEYPIVGTISGVRRAAEFVAPDSMAFARSLDATVEQERAVFEEDLEASRAMQERLPTLMKAILLEGIYGEAERPEFYQEVDLRRFSSKIELEGRAKKLLEAMQRGDDIGADPSFPLVMAYLIQRDLKDLHFIRIGVNDPIRAIVNEDGTVKEGQEDGFLGLMYPGDAAGGIRQGILEARRTVLIKRILESADGPERERLAALARDAGLAGEDGRLDFNDVFYRWAVREWVKQGRSDDGRQQQVFQHIIRLHREKGELERSGGRTFPVRMRLALIDAELDDITQAIAQWKAAPEGGESTVASRAADAAVPQALDSAPVAGETQGAAVVAPAQAGLGGLLDMSGGDVNADAAQSAADPSGVSPPYVSDPFMSGMGVFVPFTPLVPASSPGAVPAAR